MNKTVYLMAATLLISGCGSNIDDLIEYTDQVRQNTQVNIKDLPEFRNLDAVQYSVSDKRSPFQRVRSSQPVDQVAQVANCKQPNHNRTKQKLENYGLDALKMSGVFTSNGQRYALVTANDGTLHRVNVGNYIGLFHGQVTSISNTEITIKEMLPDGAGCWKPKTVSLNMSGVTGEDNNV